MIATGEKCHLQTRLTRLYRIVKYCSGQHFLRFNKKKKKYIAYPPPPPPPNTHTSLLKT